MRGDEKAKKWTMERGRPESGQECLLGFFSSRRENKEISGGSQRENKFGKSLLRWIDDVVASRYRQLKDL